MVSAVLLIVVVAAGQAGPGRYPWHRLRLPDGLLLPVALTMSPAFLAGHVQDTASLTVRVSGAADRPVADAEVGFRIAGTNAGLQGTCEPAECRTDPRGLLRFRYTGASVGQDTVTAEIPGLPVFGTSALTWTPSVRGSALAVLGDSYSAGEGTSAYLPATDRPGVNLCHRSKLAFGALIDAGGQFSSMAFRACSGAVTDDLFSPDSGGNRLPDGTVEPAQLCVECTGILPAAVGPDTRAVTLTIGGNDAGFSEVLAACLWVSELHLNYGRPGRGCSGRSFVVDPVTDRLAALAGTSTARVSAPDGRPIHAIRQILARIHAQAPMAQVYLVGYPRLFQPSAGDCYVGRIQAGYDGRTLSLATKVTPGDARWMDSVADRLNRIDRDAVAASGGWASFVDITPAFTGHGLCEDATLLNRMSGTLTVDNNRQVQAAIAPGSFHPTDQGQEQYATVLEQAGL